MKKILVIYTGGTIGMHHDHSGVLKPFDFGKITEQVPELKRLKCTVHHYAFKKLIDSSNVTPEFWTSLAMVIEDHYEKHDGFVILHGTDTMAYSASALSFMLENLGKPVIFTGSQLPLGAIRTDAKRNLITAVQIASGDVKIPEVCIFFNKRLYRGNRAEKFTSSDFDAFQSLNFPPLAEAGVNIEYNRDVILKKPSKKLKVHRDLDPAVGMLRLYPGITKEWLEHIFIIKGLKALVIETYGSGNAPTGEWFTGTLEKAIKQGVVIVNVSQCSGGRVEQGKYETSIRLKKIGVISGWDMTTEAALTKLMILFGRGKSRKEIEKLFSQPACGEMSTLD